MRGVGQHHRALIEVPVRLVRRRPGRRRALHDQVVEIHPVAASDQSPGDHSWIIARLRLGYLRCARRRTIFAMVTEPKPKAVRKKKPRRKPPEEFVDYVVEIESWGWSYWLALNTLRDPPDPYHEHRHLQIKGRMLRSTGLTTDRVEVSLFPTINLEEERRKELKPLALGALESYPDKIDAILGIPSDALAPMLQMLTADRLKFVVLRGTKFRYRSARLHSFSLSAALGEDDLWPPD